MIICLPVYSRHEIVEWMEQPTGTSGLWVLLDTELDCELPLFSIWQVIHRVYSAFPWKYLIAAKGNMMKGLILKVDPNSWPRKGIRHKDLWSHGWQKKTGLWENSKIWSRKSSNFRTSQSYIFLFMHVAALFLFNGCSWVLLYLFVTIQDNYMFFPSRPIYLIRYNSN